MRKMIVSCIWLISLIYCLLFSSLPHTYTQEHSHGKLLTLFGRVIDESTGRPLSGVEVSIADTNYRTKTDDNGEYLLKLPTGEYEVTFSAPDYKKLTKKVKLVRGRKKLDVSLTSLITYIGEELVVTAIKPAFKKPETSVIAVQQEIVKETSGPKEDIMEVFKTFPGVSVSDDFSSVFSVRGGAPRETSVFLDKIYVVAPFHFELMGRAEGFVSIFSNEMIEKATLYSGGFPAEYGNTMSAVIEIESKKAKKRQGKVSISLIDSKAFYELPIGEKSGLLFSARRNYQDLLLGALYGEGMRLIFPSFHDIHFKFHTKLTPNNILSIYGINAGTYVYFELKDREYEKATREKHKYSLKWSWGTRSNLIFARLEHKFNEQLSSISSLSFQDKYWDTIFEIRSTYRADDQEMWFRSGYHLYELKNELHFKPANHHIKLGISYTPYEVSFDMKVPKYLFEGGARHDVPERKYITTISKEKPYSLETYIQDSWEIFDRLTINYGIRYDFLSLNEDKNLSPRVSLAFGITPKTTLRAAWGHYYQMPEMTEFLPQWGGNRELKASLCHHYIVGIERELPANLNLRIEGYYKDYDKLISIDPETHRKSNTGEGYSRGIELFLERRLYRKLFGWISYTLSESKKREYRDAKEYWFDYDQRHIINIVANYKFSPKWRLNIIWRFGSGRPYTPYVGRVFDEGLREWVPIRGEKNSGRLPPYHRLDVRITKNWFFKNWQLGLYLEVLNLYNNKNVADYHWDPVGGKEVASYLLPFLPFLGIEARF